MKPSPILVINGITSSGKTTALNHAKSFTVNGKYFHQIHPIAMLKRFLEGVYDCPNLDTGAGKHFIAPGSPSNMQEIMVSLWELFVNDQIDPMFSLRMMDKELQQIPQDTPLVFNAIRNLAEVDFILRLVKRRSMDLYFIRLVPPEETILSAPNSDVNEDVVAQTFFELLPENSTTQINNPKTSVDKFKSDLTRTFLRFGFNN